MGVGRRAAHDIWGTGFSVGEALGTHEISFLAAEIGNQGGVFSNLREFPVNVLRDPWTP